MCRSVLQCDAVCCSVLQCVAVCCSVLQCVAVCSSQHTPLETADFVRQMQNPKHTHLHAHTQTHTHTHTHTQSQIDALLATADMVRQVQRSKISISKLSISFFLGPILLIFGCCTPRSSRHVAASGKVQNLNFQILNFFFLGQFLLSFWIFLPSYLQP